MSDMMTPFYRRYLDSQTALAQRRAAGEKAPQSALKKSSEFRAVDRGARRQQIFSKSGPAADITSMSQLRKYPKSFEDSSFLRSVLKESFLFRGIKEDVASAVDGNSPFQCIVDCMAPHHYKAGMNLITQGDFSDNMCFFCLRSGSAVASIDGKVVNLYEGRACFGELALIYNSPRAATVQATTDCSVFMIDIKTYKAIMAFTEASEAQSKCDFLKRCNFLDALSNQLITKLSGAVEEKHFVNGEFIIRQGQWFLDEDAAAAGKQVHRGDPRLQTKEQEFYIILEGQVKCTTNGKEVDLVTLGVGAHFGEMALLTGEPRRASCSALGNVRCLCLSRQNFQLLLGDIHEVLKQRMRVRILQSVPILKDYPDEKLSRFAETLHMEAYSDGQYIIKEGQMGDKFYIIHEGIVKCTKSIESGRKEQELVRLEANEFFGERALIKDEPRKANVIAVGSVECLVLTKAEFHELDRMAFTVYERGGPPPAAGAAGATVAGAAGAPSVGAAGTAGGASGARTASVAAPASTTSTTRTPAYGSRAASVAGPEATHAHSSEPAYVPTPLTNHQFDDLRIKQTLGTGTFGRVKLVQHSKDGSVYALKCMKKKEVVERHQDANILSEKNLLFLCSKSPFILKLYQTFQSPSMLYMLMELVQGGELWSYIYDEKKRHLLPRGEHKGFQLDAVRFYAANVILAFQHMHAHNIAYRDLKPENLLVDNQGYLKVIDFGFAKTIPFYKDGKMHEKTFTLCGTPEYLAPEIVTSKGYDKSVDCWALGCLIYELYMQRTPFADAGASNTAIFRNIVESEDRLKNEAAIFPAPCDAKFVRLVKKFLNASSAALRLGNTAAGMEDAKREPFFDGFSWAEMSTQVIPAPFKPTIKHKLDCQNFDQFEEEGGEGPPYTGDQSRFLAF